MIVFPMAGLGSRFVRAGFADPKWKLPLAGRPLLDWSLLGFRDRFASEPFLVIHLDQPGVAEFVRSRVDQLGIAEATLVALARPTAGQAETVEIGLDQAHVAADAPVTIFNIDTIRPDAREPVAMRGADGWLECFPGEGDHWSFVAPASEPHRAARVTEKVRISPFCCTGLYQFASADLFREALAIERAAPSANELYVAPMYQHLIDRGADIRFHTIPMDDIFFSGTPDEYAASLAIADTVRRRFED